MASPDEVVSAEPDTTDVAALPGLRELWTETLGDPRVCIAILDGPVDMSHPSLSEARLTTLDTLATKRAGGGPASRHGTHVASVIFGQHDGPVKGVAPRCRGLVVPVFQDGVGFQDGAGGVAMPCSQLDLARAIEQAAGQGANIINVSGGQYSPFASAHPVLADAVRGCAQKGVLIVAAAGNQGCDCLHVPGALPSVLAVGAMNARGEPLEFSNWGSVYRSEGILAPGENIPGAVPGQGIAAHSGTSYATPIVSGVAGLLASLQYMRGHKPDIGAVRKAILQSSLGCEHQKVPDCRRLLAGRLNISGAASFITTGVRNMAEHALNQDAIPAQATGPYLQRPPDGPHPGPAAGAAWAAGGPGPRADPAPAPVAEESSGSPAVRAADRRSVPQYAPAAASAAQQPTVPAAPPQPVRGPAVAPAACACDSAGGGQLVFALGTLGIDFGTEVRRDYFVSTYEDEIRNVTTPAGMYELLTRQLAPPQPPDTWLAEKIIWTLNHDETPIYAIQPRSPFAHVTYGTLISEMLREMVQPGIPPEKRKPPEQMSVAGTLGGSVTLLSGQRVPVIYPDLRGMFNWRVEQLIEQLSRDLPEDQRSDFADRVRHILERFYYDYRNLGLTPQDRALNFTATTGTNLRRAIQETITGTERFELDSIEVVRSPICRPDSDCWDVKLIFFDISQPWGSMRLVVRFAVDVSDVMPVAIGKPRTWKLR
jgi:cyanobactin maturation PatA/PatG family protease